MVQPKKQKHDARGFHFGQVKRKHRRIDIPGFVGDLADGNSIVGGLIENISAGGFKMINVPESFTAEKHTYKAILSGGDKHYKVLAKPCWRKQGKDKNNVEIGFKILDAPWEWVALTLDEIADFDTDDNIGFQS